MSLNLCHILKHSALSFLNHLKYHHIFYNQGPVSITTIMYRHRVLWVLHLYALYNAFTLLCHLFLENKNTLDRQDIHIY